MRRRLACRDAADPEFVRYALFPLLRLFTLCYAPFSRTVEGKGAWGQVVFAPLMMSLIFSAGVCPFKTRRGRRLRRSWTAWTWASVTSVKLVPLGKYSRISPPVFSLVGR